MAEKKSPRKRLVVERVGSPTGPFMLFGPPCSRKSTFIHWIPLITRGAVTAIDLESVAASDRLGMAQALVGMELNNDLIVAAANLPITSIPGDYWIVFLFEDNRETYLKRVRERADALPFKGGQKEAELWDGFKQILETTRRNIIVINPWIVSDDQAFAIGTLHALGFRNAERVAPLFTCGWCGVATEKRQ